MIVCVITIVDFADADLTDLLNIIITNILFDFLETTIK